MKKYLRRIVIIVAVVVALLGAAYFALMWFFFGPSPLQNRIELARLRQVGYVPSDARDIYISDTHGGFHGDGDTLLVYSCSADCLSMMKERIRKTYEPGLQSGLAVGWSPTGTTPLPELRRTLEWIVSADRDRAKRVPDMSDGGIIFLCGDKTTGPNAYCGALFAIDYATQRFWFMTVQT